ncbi:MAG: rhomboid family intramembrane serine protease [Bacteroidota bacterium]
MKHLHTILITFFLITFLPAQKSASQSTPNFKRLVTTTAQKSSQQENQKNKVSKLKKYPITLLIIITTTLISLINICTSTPLFHAYVLKTKKFNMNKNGYTLLTAGFIQSRWHTLALNMLYLYLFGKNVEWHYAKHWGPVKGRLLYLLTYLGGILTSNAFYLHHHKKENITRKGCAAGIYALLASEFLLHPTQKIHKVPNWISIPSALLIDLIVPLLTKQKITFFVRIVGASYGIVLNGIATPSVFKKCYSDLFQPKIDEKKHFPNLF